MIDGFQDWLIAMLTRTIAQPNSTIKPLSFYRTVLMAIPKFYKGRHLSLVTRCLYTLAMKTFFSYFDLVGPHVL